MMGLAGRYTVRPSPLVEETLQLELVKTPILPQDYTRRLAERKAQALAECMAARGDDDAIQVGADVGVVYVILGSDTVIDRDGRILEKPKSDEDARRMLAQLQGRWHQVHTGVALYTVNSISLKVELISSFVESARVKFAPLSAQDIDAYVKSGEPMDKAGSYAIQGLGGQLVEMIEGDFYAVMGLPMCRLSRELAKIL